MDLIINEHSFKGQCSDFCSSVQTIINLSDAVNSTEELRNSRVVKRTKNLKNKMIMNDKSIHTLFTELISSKEPKHRDIATRVLSGLLKGPFFKDDDFCSTIIKIEDSSGACCLNSSMHALLSLKQGTPIVVSAQGAEGYDKGEFELSVNSLKVKILNILTKECIPPYSLTYQSNEKHEILKTKSVDGKVHTKMDLGDKVATSVLKNGFSVAGDKAIYAYHKEQWYKFPPHTQGCYHGFPIGNPTNDAVINQIIRDIGQPPYENVGRIILI
ncbi:hypothetical protein [Moritella marina]|uniref:hypothetical protein n=1 Tax=Moritella marina TaxID=90736 RepID=UPI0037037CAA